MKSSRESVPVLTYHSLNVLENSYQGNDHLAFESDLRTLDELGRTIIPLSHVLDWYEGKVPFKEIEHGVALTLDDGSWLDFYDIRHPTCGPQPSMFNLLEAFRDSVSAARQPTLHISSFVISSPDAREELDQKNLLGNGWWGDDWWARARATNRVGIECHSWDHAHDTLENVAQQENIKGDFREIKTLGDCSIQVTRAAEYIEKTAGRRPSFYAYPWGQASDYMVREFMPGQQAVHQFRAAFSIEPRHVTKKDNIWFLPRYVCGRDWKSPAELKALLV